MSTFINGHRSAAPITQVHRSLVDLRKDAAEVGGRLIDHAMAHEVASRFDRISTGRVEIPEGQSTAANIASEVFRETDKRFLEIGKSGHRDPGIDTSFDVYLFPDGDQTLVILNCEQREMIDLVVEQLSLTDHHWQNSTDRPEGLTAVVWNRRRKDWDRVMPTGVPAHTCLVYNLFDGRPWMHTDRDRMWSHIPSVEERTGKIAKDIHIQANWNTDLGFSQFFDIMEAYNEDHEARGRAEDAIRGAIIEIQPETPLALRM